MNNEGASFTVSPEIFELFPGLRLPVAVADGIKGDAEYPGVRELWRRAWSEASREASSYGNAQSHPRVRAWREAMSAIGVSGRKFPSSIESLLRRALKGGEPFSINPLVDFYNAVSLGHVVPAGGFDLGALEGPLQLRLTRSGDTFHPLDGPSPERVEPGEVAYASGSEILEAVSQGPLGRVHPLGLLGLRGAGHHGRRAGRASPRRVQERVDGTLRRRTANFPPTGRACGRLLVRGLG